MTTIIDKSDNYHDKDGLLKNGVKRMECPHCDFVIEDDENIEELFYNVYRLFESDSEPKLVRICRMYCNDMRSRNDLIDVVLIEGNSTPFKYAYTKNRDNTITEIRQQRKFV